MKAIYLLAAIISISTAAAAQVHVDGYVRQDGTYVQPHMRSAPNNNPYDNYSTQGYTNPYTGQQGTVNPYQQQLQAPQLRYQRPNCSQYDPNC